MKILPTRHRVINHLSEKIYPTWRYYQSHEPKMVCVLNDAARLKPVPLQRSALFRNYRNICFGNVTRTVTMGSTICPIRTSPTRLTNTYASSAFK
jgi:hypothetical protein